MFCKSLFLFFLLLPAGTWAQDLDALKRHANAQFQQGKFAQARSNYAAYEAAKPGSAEILSGLGACEFELGHLGEAEAALLAAVQGTAKPPAQSWRYLGRLHQARFQFEEAIDYYKQFLRAANKNHPWRAGVKDDLLRCATGILVRRKDAGAAVVNLGSPINGAGDQFRPLLAPDNNKRLYFSGQEKGQHSETAPASDLFFSDLKNGDWTAPEPLSVFLNSTGHEVPQGFDEKGGLLYFFRGETLFSGDILVDTLRQNKLQGTLFLSEFDSPARAWEGDRDLFFFNDTILLFSSRRPGGHGGLDLYVATRRTDGWSAAENLGPVINSAYDETSPFLARDGRTLYFSTNDIKKSIGGLDIQRAVFLDRARKWTPPENLGIPFNSAGDDEHFFLTPDGSRVFFSSSRKQGLGQRDLYVGIFEQAKTEQASNSKPVAFHFVAPKVAPDPEAPPETLARTALHLSPLRSAGVGLPFTGASFAKLKEVAGWMKKHPELRVTFAAHTALGDDRSAGQAALQEVVALLQKEQAPLANVALRNAAAAFPLPVPKDLADSTAAAVQRRVDILLANPEVLPIAVSTVERPSSRALFFQRAMSRLVFQVKVQLGPNVDEAALFGQHPDGAKLELLAGGQQYFVHGIYLTWGAALEAQSDLAQNGFPQARAVPFLHGWELTKQEAGAMVEEFPQLAQFTGK